MVLTIRKNVRVSMPASFVLIPVTMWQSKNVQQPVAFRGALKWTPARVRAGVLWRGARQGVEPEGVETLAVYVRHDAYWLPVWRDALP